MHMSPEIMERFQQGMDAAIAAEVTEPIAMTLSSVGANDQVSSRIVLLKHYDPKGFVFFTNHTSQKGRQLAENPNAALNIFWDKTEQQVRIEGIAKSISDEESDAYFASRPRISQVGAWVSEQSQPLESRQVFEDAVAEFASRHEGQDIPRPAHWGGIRIEPTRVEFWYGRQYRLHDRFSYTAEGDRWVCARLYP